MKTRMHHRQLDYLVLFYVFVVAALLLSFAFMRTEGHMLNKTESQQVEDAVFEGKLVFMNPIE